MSTVMALSVNHGVLFENATFQFTSYESGVYDVHLLHPSKKVYPLVDYQDAQFHVAVSYKIPKIYFNKPGEYQLLVYDQQQNLFQSTSFVLLADAVGGDPANLDEQEAFEFVDFPDQIEVLEDVSFTLRSLDQTGQLDPNYSGLVHFEAEDDENAELPTDYQFVETDVGEHLFASGLMFSTAGVHTLKVYDVDDETLLAEIEVQVTEDAQDADADVLLEITEPDFASSDESQIKFVGNTNPGLDVKL